MFSQLAFNVVSVRENNGRYTTEIIMSSGANSYTLWRSRFTSDKEDIAVQKGEAHLADELQNLLGNER